jgi:hypothetical protein
MKGFIECLSSAIHKCTLKVETDCQFAPDDLDIFHNLSLAMLMLQATTIKHTNELLDTHSAGRRTACRVAMLADPDGLYILLTD